MENKTSEIFNQNAEYNAYSTLDKCLGCLHALIIFLAFTGNTASFLIFRSEKTMKKISSLFILSFVVMIDNLALITWNLDHFIEPNFGVKIEDLNLFTCKFFTFIQYFSLQCNGLLLSLVLIDRYLAVSRIPGSFASKLPFCTLKSASIWSISVIISTGLVNVHFLILNKYQDSKEFYKNINDLIKSSPYEVIQLETDEPSVKCLYYSPHFYPKYLSNVINFFLHSLIPSIIMIIFTLLLVRILRSNKHLHKNSTFLQNDKKRKKITINLITVSAAYTLMTLPSAIFFAFVYYKIPRFPWGRYLDDLVDFISFSNNASIFFSSFLTNSKFRECFLKFFNRNLLHHFIKKNKIVPSL